MNKTSLRVFAILFVFFLLGKSAQAQDEKFKAIFIYNFTKLIEWPLENQALAFTITIYGDEEIALELQNIAVKMKVGSKPIVVKKMKTLADLTETQILFVARAKTSDIPKMGDIVKNNHVLIICDKPNACILGAGLNFISKNGNLNFEVQKSNFEKAGLKINSDLLKLGTVL